MLITCSNQTGWLVVVMTLEHASSKLELSCVLWRVCVSLCLCLFTYGMTLQIYLPITCFYIHTCNGIFFLILTAGFRDPFGEGVTLAYKHDSSLGEAWWPEWLKDIEEQSI